MGRHTPGSDEDPSIYAVALVMFAAVAVISARDSSVVGGALSDAKGNFAIEDLPMGRFRLRITILGYGTLFTEPFPLFPQNPESDAGIIKIDPSAASLKEVNVSAEKLDLINSLDRKIYNVDKNIVNTGGTVTEVLSNIPSVSVDMDGKVSLRGTENVTILIDGKPSGVLGGDRKAVLQQIPASAVDQIEVITNPSAKFDADGMGGIINIKTKKGKLKGMNGTVSAGIGTNDKYNFSLGLNNRTSKMNLYANYSFRHEDRTNTGEGNQNNFFPGQAPYSYSYHSHGNNRSDFNSGKLGADFFLNKNNTLGINGSLTYRKSTQPGQSFYSFADNSGLIYNSYNTRSTDDDKNISGDAGLDYKKTWTGSKRELTGSVNYSQNERTEAGSLASSVYALEDKPYQLNDNLNKYQTVISQVDFVQPVKESGKFEAGLKNTYRRIDNDQAISNIDSAGLQYVINPNKTDHFIYDEQVFAVYSMYSGKWKQFEYNAGLRAEQTLSEGQSRSMSVAFSNDYLSLFPSAFLKYPIDKNQDIQISYSRRVNRPETRSLNPFTDYSDSLFLRKGNPELKPEYIHSMELAWSAMISRLSITATVYFRHTDDLISRFRTVDGNTGVSTGTFINYSASENLGGEAIFRYQMEKAGNVMASFNIYRNTIDGKNIEPDLQSESTQWSARLNYNFKIGKTTSGQITGNYMSTMKSPVSTFRGMRGVDAGLRQELWKGKGSLSFNVTDIFGTRKMDINMFNDYYTSNMIRKRESRVATLTLTYRFGNQDSSLFQKKKNQRSSIQQNETPEMIDY
ncbi:MAG TPA: TonB-dependent receptor [Bacteroidia bacterium]|nr:TonB-dependent receptor [Bacteroidia bacterium]